MADEQVTVRMELRDLLSRPLREVRREAAATTTVLQRMLRVDDRSTLGRVVGGIGQLTSGLRNLDGPLRRASEGLTSLTGRAIKWASIGLTAMAAATTRFGLQTASTFEQTRIAFDGFLGSAEAGREMFEYLQNLNLRTPFELGDVTGAARQLLGFGFAAGETKDLLGSVVNAAAGLGAGAEGLQRIILNLGQVRAAGVVTGRELRDFATLGFPGYELVADILGKTREEIRAMGDDARVGADEFIAAVISQQGPLQRFAGMAEQQMNSLSGLWSNFKDALQVRLADAASPLVSGLKELMPQLTTLVGEGMDKLAPPLMRLGVTLTETLVNTLPIIEPVLTAIATGASRLLDAMGPAFKALEPVGAELGQSIGRLVTALVPVMPDLVEAFVGLVGVLPEFVDLLSALVPLVAPIADVVAKLLGFEPVQGVLAGLLATLLGYRALAGVVGVVARMAGALRGLATAQTLAAASSGSGWLPGMAGGAAKGGVAGMISRHPLGAAAVAGTGIGLGVERATRGDDSFLGRIDIGKIGNGGVGRWLENQIWGEGQRPGGSRYAPPPTRRLGYEGALAAQAAAEADHNRAPLRGTGVTNNVSMNVYPQTEMDLERALGRALRRDERDRRERGG